MYSRVISRHSLMRKCLITDPKQRLTFTKVLEEIEHLVSDCHKQVNNQIYVEKLEIIFLFLLLLLYLSIMLY